MATTISDPDPKLKCMTCGDLVRCLTCYRSFREAEIMPETLRLRKLIREELERVHGRQYRSMEDAEQTVPVAHGDFSVSPDVPDGSITIVGNRISGSDDGRSRDVHSGSGQRERGGLDRGALSVDALYEIKGPGQETSLITWRHLAALVLMLERHAFGPSELGNTATEAIVRITKFLDQAGDDWRRKAGRV